MSQESHKPIYEPVDGKPMNMAVFASGGGGNLKAAMGIANELPEQMRMRLVVTDRLGIPAITIAEENSISVITRDFDKECGKWKDCKDDPILRERYAEAGERFHDSILEQIQEYETAWREPIDIVVLSYHRWIRGKLLQHFEERMINQHPGDLTVMQPNNSNLRKYIGLSPVLDALRDGQKKTRTTNFLVRDGQDNGEILCSGPWTKYTGPYPVTKKDANAHELLQKEQSDWPCLRYVLQAISEGRFGIHKLLTHNDGCKVLTFDEQPLPYKGVDLSAQV